MDVSEHDECMYVWHLTGNTWLQILKIWNQRYLCLSPHDAEGLLKEIHLQNHEIPEAVKTEENNYTSSLATMIKVVR